MDDERFLHTYRECLQPLYGWVARRTGGEQDLVEDVVQESFLRAAAHWPGEGVPREPLAWLRTVSANLLKNHYRARAPLRLREEHLEELLAHEVAPSADAAAALHRGLARLPRRAAELLAAFHLDGKDVRTIAAETGLGERAVEGRLRRARERLRRVLSPELLARGGDER